MSISSRITSVTACWSDTQTDVNHVSPCNLHRLASMCYWTACHSFHRHRLGNSGAMPFQTPWLKHLVTTLVWHWWNRIVGSEQTRLQASASL